MNTFDIGDLVKASGTFTNSAGTAIDPTAVFFKYRTPSGTVTTYAYGTDAALVRTATGVYYVNISITESGYYSWRFYSTGTGQAAEESRFKVRTSVVLGQ